MNDSVFNPMRGFYTPAPWDVSSVTKSPDVLNKLTDFDMIDQAINGTAATPMAQVAPTDRGLLSSFLPQKYADGSTGGGWGSVGLGMAQGLGSLYMGLRQYGLMKDQLNFQKDAFNKNYAAQRQSINTQLEDRQRARVASNPGAYESVGSYLDKHRIA